MMNSAGLGAAAVRRRVILGLAAASLLLTGAPPPGETLQQHSGELLVARPN